VIAPTGSYVGGDSHRNAYFDHPAYDDGGRLHLTWTWRETAAAGTNHDIMYAYSDDDGLTWYNSANNHVATTGSNPIVLGTTGITVWAIGINRGLYNNEGSYVEDDGTVHVVTQHMPTALPDDSNFATAFAKRTYHHYWRNPSTGVWSKSETTFSGTRPSLIVNSSGDAYMVFQDGGRLRIARGTDAAGYSDWQVIYTEMAHKTGVEPIIDWDRWHDSGVLSVYVQDQFTTAGLGSPLRILEYALDFASPVSPDGAAVGNWDMDSIEGNEVSDVSLNNLHGTLTNSPTVDDGVIADGLRLDGSNDYVEIADHSFLDGMATVTAAVWVKMDDVPGTGSNYSVLGKDASSAQASYRLNIAASGIPHFAVKTTNNGWYSAGTTAVGATALSVGVWYHLVGTYDGTTTRLYVNGALAATGSQSISGSVATGTSPVRLGYDTGANIEYFDGVIDEARVYRIALNGTAVTELYRQPFPIGEWELDEGTGTAAVEESGVTALEGTLTGNPTWLVPGKAGSAVQFDGNGDYVAIADNSLLDGMDALTVSAWVNLDTWPGTATYSIVGKDTISNAQSSYRLAVGPSGIVSFAVRTDAYDFYATGTVAESPTGISAGAWHHLVGTYDGTTVRLYVDGASVDAGNSAIQGQISQGTSTLRFGNRVVGTSAYAWYDGAIDDVQIYRRALTGDEVNALYSSY